MALPPPPKYRRLIEEHDSKHVLKERAKREAAKALAVARFKAWVKEQERKRASSGTVTITVMSGGVTYSSDPRHLADVKFYID